MKLSEYLSENEISQAAFARDISESPQNVGRYVNGDRIPEEDAMIKIFNQTQGQVTANDFYGITPETKAKNIKKKATVVREANGHA